MEEDGDIVNYEIENFNKETIFNLENLFRKKNSVIKAKTKQNDKIDDLEIRYKSH
jgi:hypothetical protein